MREILALLAAMIISPPGSAAPRASRSLHPRSRVWRTFQMQKSALMLVVRRSEVQCSLVLGFHLRNLQMKPLSGYAVEHRTLVHDALRREQTFRPSHSSKA